MWLLRGEDLKKKLQVGQALLEAFFLVEYRLRYGKLFTVCVSLLFFRWLVLWNEFKLIEAFVEDTW